MPVQVTKNYGTVTSNQAFAEEWDLTRGELVISYKLDMSAYRPPQGATAWTTVGLRTNNNLVGWISSGSPEAVSSDPNNQDLDDKHNLGTPGRYDETSYDVLPDNTISNRQFNTYQSYGLWFDRTGVNQWQAAMWGMVNGGTYNSGGIYNIAVKYRLAANDPNRGTMFATVNGIETGFYKPNWHDGKPEIYPAGKSITGNLNRLKVFVSGLHSLVGLSDLKVTGYLANQSPAITEMVVQPYRLKTSEALNLTITFIDSVDVDDTHTAEIEWGDGTVTTKTVEVGTFTVSHVYTDAGIYTVKATISDNYGAAANGVFECLVYDPEAGHLTGGGWITSPEGAYMPDTHLTEKAEFNFECKYHKDKEAPSGHLEFHLKETKLKLHEVSFEWMILTPDKAYCRGAGKIGKEEGYTFLLTVIDSGKEAKKEDKFRMQIWTQMGVLLYDNEPEDELYADPTTIIGGGSIQIHLHKE